MNRSDYLLLAYLLTLFVIVPGIVGAWIGG
ncbi:hypothetical protein UFOVP154_4 [uncultured Caudovirales phage]|uniref:Uncharacterized protein n=1 Tax=uncultured Caudovirales phage TaxID=2100421 RepID=A0A6J7WCI5_9CAUD|nr:hypothetical protein UFOVP8_53 [uncultured Caudovirales phage]CAB5170126.1 hypothetical protein UFOVP154_4 [uncultured Caudovirales phage]